METSLSEIEGGKSSVFQVGNDELINHVTVIFIHIVPI